MVSNCHRLVFAGSTGVLVFFCDFRCLHLFLNERNHYRVTRKILRLSIANTLAF